MSALYSSYPSNVPLLCLILDFSSIWHLLSIKTKWTHSSFSGFYLLFLIIMLKQVGRMTLGGLLALGYTVVVSYKRASTTVNNVKVSISSETIDALGETFMVMRGTNRKVTIFSCNYIMFPFKTESSWLHLFFTFEWSSILFLC